MARYSVTGTATTGTDDTIMQYMCAASPPNRLELHFFCIGSVATPADAVALWEVEYCTTEGTGGTVPTPEPLNEQQTGSPNFTARQAPTGEPTTAGIFITVPIHQRSTFSWVATPGGEIITPMTADNGVAFHTGAGSGTFSAHVCAHVEE